MIGVLSLKFMLVYTGFLDGLEIDRLHIRRLF